MNKHTLFTILVAVLAVGTIGLQGQESAPMGERIAALERKVMNLEQRVSILEGGTKIGSELDLSSPERAARSFWTALSSGNKEDIDKHFLTPDEMKRVNSRATPQQIDSHLGKVRRKIETRGAEYLNTKFLKVEIDNRESFGGYRAYELDIHHETNGNVSVKKIVVIELQSGTWKLSDF